MPLNHDSINSILTPKNKVGLQENNLTTDYPKSLKNYSQFNNNNSHNNFFKSGSGLNNLKNTVDQPTIIKHTSDKDIDSSEMIIAPKIEKYQNAEKILESHRERNNKINISSKNVSLFSHINISPTIFTSREKEISNTFFNSKKSGEKTEKNDKNLTIKKELTRNSINLEEDDPSTSCSPTGEGNSSQINRFKEPDKNPTKTIYIANEKENSDFTKTGLRLNLIHKETSNTHNSMRNQDKYKYSENPKISSRIFDKDEVQSEIKIFLNSPTEKNVWQKCYIERKIMEKKTTKYSLFSSKDNKLLISACKKNKKSYYLSLKDDTNINQAKDDFYLGKLKSNFFGTEFNIYDNGKKIKNDKAKDAGLCRETNLFGLKGPRKMKVLLATKPLNNGESIVKRYINKNSCEKENIMAMSNKLPTWSEKHKCYVLDYKERSIKQSVKNFQLTSHNTSKINDEILLQFGRTGENSFILDFKFPFSPLQAFSVALSSIDSKIACE